MRISRDVLLLAILVALPRSSSAQPVLRISKTHTGNFTQWQTGASYTVTVSNAGAGPTSGMVTVSESLPAGLTLVSMFGYGWMCASNGTCTRSDVLARGASHTDITVTVAVAGNASSPQVNTVTVGGGGSVTAYAADSTTIMPAASLSISLTHTGSLAQGQRGTYTVTVSNHTGIAWTGVPEVSVSFSMSATQPLGWTVLSMVGSGWDCRMNANCSRSDVLAAEASYPPIAITVYVASDAPAQVNAQATLSYFVVTGAYGTWVDGPIASDTTAVLGPPLLGISKTHSGSFIQGQTGATYVVIVSNGASAGPSYQLVTVSETLPAGLTLASMAGSGWSCPTASGTCTRSDVLNPGSSYPPITVTVSVPPNAPAQVTNQVTVSSAGGLGTGSAMATANDYTDVTPCPSGRPAACDAPIVSAVLNGASYTSNLSPGTWMAIFGTNLAPSAAAAQSVPLPTQVNGVSITVWNTPTPLSYVSPTQVNALFPFEAPSRGALPVVVTSGAGASTPFYVQPIAAEAPGLFTQNGAGTGSALVFDSSFQPVATVGQDPLILYATGLGPTNPPASSSSGGNSTPPLNWVVDPVDVYVGDRKATVLFAGLAPGFPGVYQLNVQPNGAMTDRVYLRSGFWQSNIAQVGVAAGNNVSNVIGSIAGLYPLTDNLPSTYKPPSTMQPVRISAMLFAAVFNARFYIAINAQPFDLVATTEAATAAIHFDTRQGVYTVTLTVPSFYAGHWDFSGYGSPVYSCGTPTPPQIPTAFQGNIVPLSAVDSVAAWALSQLPPDPNGNRVAAAGANITVVTTGNFTPGTTFMIDASTHPEISTFGGFIQIPCVGGPKSRTTTFSLYLDGRLIASKTGTYSLAQ